jgi:glycosyltransferase involved in cell wall biosynthesis
LINEITPLLICFNEEKNLPRVLDKLRWARRIVIVDSGSTDGTLEIIARYHQAEVVHRPFDTFADQCNFGLANIRTKWVLSLDADYELSNELVRELHDLEDIEGIAGYRAAFIYRIYGRPLRGTLYPPRTVLHHVRSAHYVNEGHGHKVSVPDGIAALKGVIYHDDRKPLARWFTSQQIYARVEADHLCSANTKTLSRTDRIRRMALPAPILVLPYTLIVKRCAWDGWAGWFYTLQRVLAEIMIALEINDRRLAGRFKHKDGAL